MNKKARERRNTKIVSILVILCLLIFVGIAYLVGTNNINWFDDAVYSVISKLKSNPMTVFFQFITFFCSTKAIIVMLILILIVARNKKNSLLVIYNTIGCFLLNQGVKFIFERPRPTGINIIDESGFSFPSGHSMVSLAFYGLFIYIISTKFIPPYKKVFSIIGLGLMILLIGISRIYLGVHYASDVLAGFLLSLAYLLVYINIVYKKFYR